MIVGGQAVLVHGEPRLTRDIDVTLGADVDRLADALRAAESADLTVLVDPEEFTRTTMVLPCRHAATGIRVDFIFSFSDYERDAIARAIDVPLGDISVRFASAEDLVIHKVVAGRPRDMEDARSVLLKNPALDRRLVRAELTRLQEAVERPLVDSFESLDPPSGA
jgi:hypothetical protein